MTTTKRARPAVPPPLDREPVNPNDRPLPAPAIDFRVIAQATGPPAPQPAPGEATRVCAVCLTRVPISHLSQSPAFLACLDEASCAKRARASQIYPQREDETAIAAHQLSQGAVLRI